MVNQDSLNFDILTSPQGRRRSWPSESITSLSQKADHGPRVTINSFLLPPDLFLTFNCRPLHQSRVTPHESRFHFFFTSLLRYLLTSSFTSNCKLTTLNCFSPRPVDRRAIAGHNFMSMASSGIAVISEEGE
jgi:hypothetical protein